MVTTVRSLGLQGISGYEVTVECFLSGGLPAFDVVGLGDTAVKEARERVRAAIKNCGAKFPVSRITVNLAPANLKKEGTVYDLPLLLGILAGEGEIDAPDPASAFIGELSLTGALRPISGVLPMAMAAARAGVKTLYVPAANAAEATLAAGLTGSGGEHAPQLLRRPPVNPSTPPRPRRSFSAICAARSGSPPRSAGSLQSRRTAFPISPTSWDRRMSSARWRSPPQAPTTCFSSARPVRASPCSRGVCPPSSPT